ncbi:MAG TPA: hypothetical protein VFQ53_15495 [Kofleriaceae bacterium]|nr:hypothetical protein [Kofleriaceae bacterium]
MRESQEPTTAVATATPATATEGPASPVVAPGTQFEAGGAIPPVAQVPAPEGRPTASELAYGGEQGAIQDAFAGAPKPHPEQSKYRLSGPTSFGFNTPDVAQWPAQLTTFLSDQFGVDRARLGVKRFGAGKSGDFVFGVFLDAQNLGVLKIYRDPAGAGVDAEILHVVDAADMPHYQPAEEKGSIGSVTIDGAAGSSLFTELVPGRSIEALIQGTPQGMERAAHLDMLERATRNAAVMFAELHTTMASGKQVDATHKQNEAKFIMTKFGMVRSKNDSKHFTTGETLDRIERTLWDQIIPKFVASPLPATAYHGDAHAGNVVVDEQLNARPIDLTAMKWSLDGENQGKQTGAVDVGQFIARLHEKSEGALDGAEIQRLEHAFLDEYFRHSTVAEADMRAGMVLYAVESQFARIAYDIGEPQNALAAATHLLGLA